MPQPIPAFIERLERQRSESLSTIDSVLARCADEDRDPTEVEEATLTDARGRLERAETQRGEWVGLLESRASGDEIGNRVQGALARSAVSRPDGIVGVGAVPDPEAELPRLFRSAGEYIYDVVRHQMGVETSPRLQRAVANQLLASNPGIVPVPIIGPVVDTIARVRPVFASVAARAMPQAGSSFIRPNVTQHTTVGPQTTEKTELSSQAMTIAPITVNKATYGGTLDISFQNRDWTDPAILQIVVDDLATVYARQVESAFSTYFAATPTGAGTIATWDGPGITHAIAQATGTIMTNTLQGAFPDTLWVSPDVWASLASVCDTAGRPLFPQIGPMNAAGSVSPANWTGNIWGIRIVVGPFLPGKTMILGVSTLCESYEQIGGQLSITEPTILGFVVAYYGYVAWAMVRPNAFVKLTATAGVGPFEAESGSASSGK